MKVGQRVMVYGNMGTHGLKPRKYDYFTYGLKGTVVESYGELKVKMDKNIGPSSGCTILVHPKQCRKLRKK